MSMTTEQAIGYFEKKLLFMAKINLGEKEACQKGS